MPAWKNQVGTILITMMLIGSPRKLPHIPVER